MAIVIKQVATTGDFSNDQSVNLVEPTTAGNVLLGFAHKVSSRAGQGRLVAVGFEKLASLPISSLGLGEFALFAKLIYNNESNMRVTYSGLPINMSIFLCELEGVKLDGGVDDIIYDYGVYDSGKDAVDNIPIVGVKSKPKQLALAFACIGDSDWEPSWDSSFEVVADTSITTKFPREQLLVGGRTIKKSLTISATCNRNAGEEENAAGLLCTIKGL